MANLIKSTYKTRLKKFAFKKVNDDEVLSIINKLKNKKSRGADNISNQLLKTIKQELCKPLTIIIATQNDRILPGQFHLFEHQLLFY